MSEELKRFPMRGTGGKPQRCRLIDADGNVKVFDSMTEAADWVVGDDGNTRAALSNISQAIRTNVLAYGFKWERVEE